VKSFLFLFEVIAPMPFPRSCGILLHPTSFPSRYGIGDLGREAYQFVDFLVESGQQLWQILPLGPTGYGNSPYMSFSALAGNPLLLSPDILLEKGLLTPEDIQDIPQFPLDKVDFEKVITWKMPILRQAARNFNQNTNTFKYRQFEGFCHGNSFWLDDYALFMAILDTQGGKPWTEWPDELRNRDWNALKQITFQLAEEIFIQKFLQFEFLQQWTDLRRYTNELNISIIGDIPIYVAHNSADVWANPQLFRLNSQTGQPEEMAGVPPDYFSATGQLWGNPIYNWEQLQETNFEWWVRRVKGTLALVDIIRIDHFRGLESYWSVPGGETTAVNGCWIKAPGLALFNKIREKLGVLPIMAEDLGEIDQNVIDLRDHFQFPGMNILHFAFGSDSQNPYLPFNINHNSVVYTGTHDNNTTVGWYYDNTSEYGQKHLSEYIGAHSSHGVAWDLIRLALSSVSNQAIIPLQDIFSLGSDARMNTPGLAEGNWGWRYRAEALNSEYSTRLRDMVMIYGRYQGF
jgi:4-alpha-glucanotransferase